MDQQLNESTVAVDQTPVQPEHQWGPGAPKGGRAVFARIIKEGANVPLFLGQTLINGLRDLGYTTTTSGICEHVDNAFQWSAKEVRVYFHEKGKKGRRIDVLILDDGVGMPPNVLRAVTAFGGSLCYDNRETVGKYGIGMKAAALSMGPTLEIYSWQEEGGIYNMMLDTEEISNERTNMVLLPEPKLIDRLPPEIREILVQPMSYPKNAYEQELFVTKDEDLIDQLGPSGTIVYIPDCDRLTYRRAQTLADHATKEMARIYRRFLTNECQLYVNNRRVQLFDPTYRMEDAWHTRVAELKEKRSRLILSENIPIPVDENARDTREVKVQLFLLPIEEWDQLPRTVQKNKLRIFENTGISFVRNGREIHMGPLHAIIGKMGTRDSWWRLEIDFPAALDEAMGVAVNKQGVRPKDYVTQIIKKAIREELSRVRNRIDEHWSRRATEADKESKVREAEQRANEAEAFQSTLLPESRLNDQERIDYEKDLRAFATALKREGETDEEAYERIKASRYVIDFKYDEDAPFYRVDYKFRKIILTINKAHPFFKLLYTPLAQIAKRSAGISISDGEEPALDPELVKSCSGAVVTLELFLLSLARTQSEMIINDQEGELQQVFDKFRQQWSINLKTQLTSAQG